MFTEYPLICQVVAKKLELKENSTDPMNLRVQWRDNWVNTCYNEINCNGKQKITEPKPWQPQKASGEGYTWTKCAV